MLTEMTIFSNKFVIAHFCKCSPFTEHSRAPMAFDNFQTVNGASSGRCGIADINKPVSFSCGDSLGGSKNEFQLFVSTSLINDEDEFARPSSPSIPFFLSKNSKNRFACFSLNVTVKLVESFLSASSMNALNEF